MNNYQLYEILLFFALYSILGWAADKCVFALRRRQGGKGLCKGPYLPAFGAAALLVVAWSGPAARQMAAWMGTGLDMLLSAAAICGLAAGAVCAFAAAVLTRLCSGRWLIHVSASDLLLWMAGAVILAAHLQPLVVAVTRHLSPWIHMIFLTVFYLQMTGDCIDGISRLLQYRKQGTFSKETE